MNDDDMSARLFHYLKDLNFLESEELQSREEPGIGWLSTDCGIVLVRLTKLECKTKRTCFPIIEVKQISVTESWFTF
jgi:hypothetical protein